MFKPQKFHCWILLNFGFEPPYLEVLCHCPVTSCSRNSQWVATSGQFLRLPGKTARLDELTRDMMHGPMRGVESKNGWKKTWLIFCGDWVQHSLEQSIWDVEVGHDGHVKRWHQGMAHRTTRRDGAPHRGWSTTAEGWVELMDHFAPTKQPDRKCLQLWSWWWLWLLIVLSLLASNERHRKIIVYVYLYIYIDIDIDI